MKVLNHIIELRQNCLVMNNLHLMHISHNHWDNFLASMNTLAVQLYICLISCVTNIGTAQTKEKVQF